jgi:hypothetical protein
MEPQTISLQVNWPTQILSRPEPNAIGFDDPEFTGWRPVSQNERDPMCKGEDRLFVLHLGPKNNDSRVLRGRVCADIGEIQVERDQYPSFGLRSGR